MTKPKNEKSVERFSKMTCSLANCTKDKATATEGIGTFRLAVAVEGAGNFDKEDSSNLIPDFLLLNDVNPKIHLKII
jgi:hypothetical protein